MKTIWCLHLYCAAWPNLVNKGRKEGEIKAGALFKSIQQIWLMWIENSYPTEKAE